MRKRILFGIFIAAVVCGLAAASAGAGAASDEAAPGADKWFRLGFSFSGGWNRIDGGDFNRAIRDANRWVADMNAGEWDYDYTIYWKQLKIMPDWKGEVFARFGRHLGLGLGVEYLRKTNSGIRSLGVAYSETEPLDDYLIAYSEKAALNDRYPQTLTIVPVTLNVYGYLPLGRRGEAYVAAGPGLYLGRLRLSSETNITIENQMELFTADGSERIQFVKYQIEGRQTETQKATGRAVGFQIGAGFSYALTGHLSLFGEALYRRANIKNWKGSGAYDTLIRATQTGTGHEPVVRESTGHEDWDGDLWSYEYTDYATDVYYSTYGVMEEKPGAEDYRNIRKAEINVNGPTVRFGIRFSFGLGRKTAH